MRNEPSIPDRFVTTWAAVQAMPAYDIKDSRRHVLASLQREAVDALAVAISHADRLAQLSHQMLIDTAPKGNVDE